MMTRNGVRIWFLIVSVLLACTCFYSCAKDPAAPAGKSQPKTSGILYASSYTDDCILVFDDAKNVDGIAAPDRVISGAGTGIDNPNYNGMFVDSARDRLYVSCNGAVKSIRVFADASTANGDVAPLQVIEGAATGLVSPSGVFVRGDRIYVANGAGHNILVFDINAVGNAAPIASITADNMFRPYGVYVDASGSMYVAFALTLEVPFTLSDEIKIFDGMNTMTGTHHQTPSRILTSGFLDDYPASVWVDESRNKLFVSVRNRHAISVYNNANTLNGVHDPDFTCATGLSYPMTIAYDRVNNVIYQVQDNNAFIVNAWNNASAITDRVPDRTITPSVHQASIYGVAIDPTR